MASSTGKLGCGLGGGHNRNDCGGDSCRAVGDGGSTAGDGDQRSGVDGAIAWSSGGSSIAMAANNARSESGSTVEDISSWRVRHTGIACSLAAAVVVGGNAAKVLSSAESLVGTGSRRAAVALVTTDAEQASRGVLGEGGGGQSQGGENNCSELHSDVCFFGVN